MEDVFVVRMRTGPWGEVCYLLRAGTDAILIDPGGQADVILRTVEREACTVHAVLLTHGHFDHVGAVAPVAEHFGSEVYMSSADSKVLRQANVLRFVFKSKEPVFPPRTWTDLGQEDTELRFGELVVSALGTPGHTPGSFCFSSGTALFTGDTLLSGGVGTAELPGGDKAALASSLARLATMPHDARVFPGHGTPADLGSYLGRTLAT